MNNLITLRQRKQAIVVKHDPWVRIDSIEAYQPTDENVSYLLPFHLLTEDKDMSLDIRPVGVWLSNDIDVDLLKPWLDSLQIIALELPKFTDGRAYSQAVELRTRLG